MNRKLLENNYLIIPNFISSYRSNKLCEEYKNYSIENNLNGDAQSPNSHSSYNYISFLELLCEKTPEISEILEETVLPSYSYARVYKKGSILERHTDRDSCEISLTVHLGGDRSWEIFIKNPKGEDCSVNLNPGDAMLYLGKIAEHWRNEYNGEWYTQVFLHYVRSRGDYFENYFDKKNLGIESYTNKKNNHKENILFNDVVKKESIVVNASSKLEDFIQVFDDILSESECDDILNEYKDSNEWMEALTGDLVYNDRSIRNCDLISISMEEIIKDNHDARKRIDDILFNSIGKVINQYNEIFPTFNIDIDTGYQLLRYEEGQFYKQHTDSYREQQRSLSCSIQLNEDYDGGEFAFFDREIMIRSKKGSVIVFPSNFMYPHEIMPVIKGTRYSIITWLV